MVTSYTPQTKYRLDKLDNVVYLISEEDARHIYIDKNEAHIYIDSEVEPLSMEVYNIALSDSDELDNRYKFTHQLQFSVRGYVNHNDFQGKYFAIVKSLNNTYWLVNPKFPCKVTYTYTLDSISEHTDFTLSTVSNHPTLRILNFDKLNTKNCIGYFRCLFKSLKLNEKRYSSLDNNNVIKYTNDGFKDILYDKNSASFVEQFDGENVSHTLKFNVSFDDYKSSWHYNLLEFIDNKYSAIIESNCGKYILCGFGFGLNPSFNVTANDEATPDRIEITLSDLHDNGDTITYTEEPRIEADHSKSFVFTSEHYGYECVDIGKARYLLKAEIDALGNPTDRYICLIGYEPRFGNLNLIGTFNETEEFVNPSCNGEQCTLQTSLPNTLKFETRTCRQYSLLCDTDWNIVSSSQYIRVNPSSGLANTPYVIDVCNDYEATYTSLTATITATYCNGSAKTFTVIADKTNSCFPMGQTFDVTANGQYITVPTKCCVMRVEDSTVIRNVIIQNNYIKIYVPQNNTNLSRSITLTVVFCDGTSDNITINQSVGFERWVKETTACTNNLLCDVLRRYTGTSASDINTWTNETKYDNCVESSECSVITTRWIDSSETTCANGRKYIVQVEQMSDGGQWVETGRKRLGNETEDSPAECEGQETEEKWEVVENDYICNDTVKYAKERLYTRTVGSSEWIPTDVYRRSTTIIEADSMDCGFLRPTTAWTCTKWVGAEGYICEETTKYARQQLYVSMCSDCENCDSWIPQDVYMLVPTTLEYDSADCGYDPTLSGNCVEWRDNGDTICNGFSAHTYLRKYVRECIDCENCVIPWTESNIYKRGGLINGKSLDCGYVPNENFYEWRDNGTTICDAYNKYRQERKYISEDGNNWLRTNILRQGSLIEVNSEDCGYVEPIQYEYRWILTERTECIGTDKYYDYKKQRRISGQTEWKDTVPTQFSYNGNGTMPTVIAEAQSADCGYIPPTDPIYEWRLMSTDYICDECSEIEPIYEWRLMSTDYICDECEEPPTPTTFVSLADIVASSTTEGTNEIYITPDVGGIDKIRVDTTKRGTTDTYGWFSFSLTQRGSERFAINGYTLGNMSGSGTSNYIDDANGSQRFATWVDTSHTIVEIDVAAMLNDGTTSVWLKKYQKNCNINTLSFHII